MRPIRYGGRTTILGVVMPSGIRRLVASLVLATTSVLAPGVGPVPAAHAQASWLDQPVPTSWSSVGMAVPAAPTGGYSNPSRGRDERPAETAEDLAVTAKGTYLSPAPGENTLGATFNRYAAADPLCCPSAQTSGTYLMERNASGPVLVPVRAETRPNTP